MKSITDIRVYTSQPETPLRDLLKRIDRSTHLFQVIVDRDGRLLGTVTDGDIRRAMLHGVELDDQAQACMNKSPVTGVPDKLTDNRLKLDTLGSSRNFLPIVSTDGIVREILVSLEATKIGRAMVMAGGLGTRLGERTRTTPKPLISVGGRPILDHVLHALENAGIEQIVISAHYLPEQIENFIAKRKNKAAVSMVLEPKQLGTAGALGLLDEEAKRDPLLVVNGDVVSGVDLSALLEFHERHGHDATIAVASHEVNIPFGVIRYGQDGLLEQIEEKPKITNFIAAGVYYLSPEHLALAPFERSIDMPELLNAGKKLGLRTGLFPIHEYWTDVGRPDDLDAADKLLSEQ